MNEYDVIVVGGGIIGCSTAYHLARDEKKNVLLLEQGTLTSGTTWHAAGLVGQLRTSAAVTQLLRYSVQFYHDITTETGLETGWRMTGCLRLAKTAERMVEYRRAATTAKSFGLDMHILNAREAKDLFPLIDERDLLGASFLPSDGQASPSDITMAIAKGARTRGVEIKENCQVLQFITDNHNVRGVQTNQGDFLCAKIVLCAGIWTRQLAGQLGVDVPLVPVKHQYVITEKMAGITNQLPTIRDPDNLTYFKEEVGGLVFGGYEPNPQPFDIYGDNIPKLSFHLCDDDFDHFEPMMENAMARIPQLANTGIKKMMHGAESFTPDGNFILGKAPLWNNVFVGTGFNAFGIASGGGAGKALAYWVANGESPSDLWSVDLQRFHAVQNKQNYLVPRTLEAYAKHYAPAYPNWEYDSARGVKKSPIYDQLTERGAVMGSKLGWERVNYVNTSHKTIESLEKPSMGRGDWFQLVGNEHKILRESCGLIDQTSFAKYKLVGAGAELALNYLCSMPINKNIMRVNYRQMLNHKGGIECDLAITKLNENEFYIVTGTGFRMHDFDWIHKNTNQFDCQLSDITEEMGVLSVMGPHSRDILNRIATAPLQQKYGQAQYIHIKNSGPILAMRISYIGELGYELHCNINDLSLLYNQLHQLPICGYRAIESTRLEKAYRAWGADISGTDNPFSAGMPVGFDHDYIGKEAIMALHNKPLTRKLVSVSCDGNVVLNGRETILRNGQIVGYLRSAGYGYTLQKSIGMGYLVNQAGIDDEYIANGEYKLVVANDEVPCVIHCEALYDPKGERLKV